MTAIDDASHRRDAAAGRVGVVAEAIDGAAAAMARRFEAGGTLCAVGSAVSAIDADHVRVEFLHPVTVGRRAIAATIGVAAATAGDVVLALRLDDDPAPLHELAIAAAGGALTIDLFAATATPAPHADHSLGLGGIDPFVGRELQVTTYHVLWEMVHEHLEQVAPATGGNDLDQLYPMLRSAGSPPAAAHEHVQQSIVTKADEAARLRAEALERDASALADAAHTIVQAGRVGASIWCFGNGGSSTDAGAFAHLLAADGRRARSLADDAATITALANDVGFDRVFARMLRAVGRSGDVAVAFSTSGDSANLIAALDTARSMGMATVGFAGGDGGRMAEQPLDHRFVVPSSSVHRIQEVQTTLAHVLVELARR